MIRPFSVLLIAGALAAAPASAQFGTPGDLTVAVSAATVGFSPKGVSEAIDFRFEGPVWGAVFTRQGIHAAAYWGVSESDGQDLDLFDVNVGLVGAVLEDRTEGMPVYVPVMLHSTYRRVRRKEGGSEFAAFEYTGIGLGLGLGARHLTDRIALEARVVPGIGLATRSFGTSTGLMTLVDADVEMRAPMMFGRFGLSLGLGYRGQSWRVGGPDAFDAAGAGRVTYSGTGVSARVGLNW